MKYPVKNYLERGVKSEVERQKGTMEHGGNCWCSVCDADVHALALTILPPRYCQEGTYTMPVAPLPRWHVESAVRKAAARVHDRPKHQPGVPSFYPHRVRVVDFVMEEATAMVKEVMKDLGAPCLCLHCQADTLAIALNNVPPLYGVEVDGEVRLPPTKRDFYRHDLAPLLEDAARTVARHPHH